MKAIDIVMVGHISQDTVIIDGRRQESVGGAVYFAAFAARPAGIKMLVITKLAIRDHHLLHDFWERGIPVLPIPAQRTTAMVDLFDKASGYARSSKITSLAPPYRCCDIPIGSAGIYYLGGLVRGDIPETLIETLSRRGKVALDIQGILRARKGKSLVMRDWRQKERYLGNVYYLKADMDEAKLLTGKESIEEIISCVHNWGVKELLITDKDGVKVSDGSTLQSAAFQSYQVEGRNGRGDTCFASYLSYRLRNSLKESFKHCLEITNQKLQRPGPFSE
jgi:sugar/nucleoside kinase (ribokinase family)